MTEYTQTNRDTSETVSQELPDWDNPESLDVCIVGAGAVGGLIGGQMALSGANVTLVDQGPHLEALRETGLSLISRDGEKTVVDAVDTTDTIEEDRPTDLVVLGVKAYTLPEVAPMIPKLVDSRTAILPVQNGIPWWYFQRFGGEFEGYRIDALDPDGVLERYIETERVVGCVPFVAATVVKPGTVKHIEGEWFPVGELDGEVTPRVRGIAELFERVELRSRVLEDIRSEVWLKALGNLAFNPISALTRATLREICSDPGTRMVARKMMEEAKLVAEELGADFRRSIDERIDGAEAVGDHKTSMLQDVERHNRLETEALLGSVIELAELTDTPTPTIETIYVLVNLLEKTHSNS